MSVQAFTIHLAQSVLDELRERLDIARSNYLRAQAEHQRATAPTAPAADLAGLVSEWFRGLVRDFHPDRGGEVQVMQALNEAHVRLKKLVERA